jgi:hypothetical protein
MCEQPRYQGYLTAASFAALSMLHATAAPAFDVNEQFSIGGILAAAGQCQNGSALLPSEDFGEPIEGTDPLEYNTDLDKFGNECRGGLPVQIEFDYRPTDNDQFFIALGWAVDNGLNEVSPFRLAPWAADLEDDVQDINGSSRDYLLQAWYRHRFEFQGGNSVAGTFGILDSTGYLDVNEYANDEYTQFMNEAFTNAGSYNLPSYDAGVAIEAEFGSFSVNAVGMNINENDEGNNYNFWGAQIGWHPEFKIGAGNYRINVSGTSSEFSAPPDYVEPTPDDEDLVLVDGRALVEVPGQEEALLAWGLSFDQAIGEVFGVFTRMAWQSGDAAVDYDALYSGGINILGSPWRRPDDNIGLGYAYLEGGNTDVKRTNVFEAYYRASLNEYFAITADVQYMDDDLDKVDPMQQNPDGWIFGLRATAAF